MFLMLVLTVRAAGRAADREGGAGAVLRAVAGGDFAGLVRGCAVSSGERVTGEGGGAAGATTTGCEIGGSGATGTA